MSLVAEWVSTSDKQYYSVRRIIESGDAERLIGLKIVRYKGISLKKCAGPRIRANRCNRSLVVSTEEDNRCRFFDYPAVRRRIASYPSGNEVGNCQFNYP